MKYSFSKMCRIQEKLITLRGDGEICNMVEDFYSPFYTFFDGDVKNSDFVVTVEINNRGPVLTKISDMTEYLKPGRLISSGDSKKYIKSDIGIEIEVISGLNEIIIRGSDPYALNLQTRVTLRDQVFQPIELANGMLLVHAAAVEKDGNAYIFLGNRNAGKTTSLLSLITAKCYNFLSADRIKIHYTQDKGPVIHGIPARCNIHLAAFENNQLLESLRPSVKSEEVHGGKFLVSADKITAISGASTRPFGKLAAIVLPRIIQDAKFSISVTSDENSVRSAITSNRLEWSPGTLHNNWLGAIPDVYESIDTRTEKVVASIVENKVPVVRVESSYQDYVAWMTLGGLSECLGEACL
jgi:hypothetical protein